MTSCAVSVAWKLCSRDESYGQEMKAMVKRMKCVHYIIVIYKICLKLSLHIKMWPIQLRLAPTGRLSDGRLNVGDTLRHLLVACDVHLEDMQTRWAARFQLLSFLAGSVQAPGEHGHTELVEMLGQQMTEPYNHVWDGDRPFQQLLFYIL